MENASDHKLDQLRRKGVHLPAPQTVEIGPEVDIDRISGQGVVIHTGCRLAGSQTWVQDDVHLGAAGPVSLTDCQLGPKVTLESGVFTRAVFLEQSRMGPGAHVRQGTILEELASGAHCVGLKQTILLPFVTLGSLINFCDCLMAGGTSRKDHSEVGSAYIHFNYTPQQDKATPSLIGDVPQGVMLNQHPIFLGGQGGLVGPTRLAFGTVTAAGTVWRKDELRPDRLLSAGGGRDINVPFKRNLTTQVNRKINNNIIYIANLIALGQWYRHVRGGFISNVFAEPLWHGLQHTLDTAIDERIKRLEAFWGQLEDHDLRAQWPAVGQALEKYRGHGGDRQLRDGFLESVATARNLVGNHYIDVIKSLTPQQAQHGTDWLQGIVDYIADAISSIGSS